MIRNTQVTRDLSYNHVPLALVGIGCNFPGEAHGPAAFWDQLKQGVDAVTSLSDHRKSLFEKFNSKSPNEIPANLVGGFLFGVDKFDAKYFNISARVASKMDPQQRMFLEVGCEALFDANIRKEALASSEVGVFVGVTSTDYRNLVNQQSAAQDIHAMAGTSRHAIAGRLASFLELSGPCLTVDTSTSSSLSAVHLASESIRNQECDIAICGGVNLVLDPKQLNVFFNQGYLSSDARCRFGDSLASGAVLGEGVGVVVLKRLSKALEDDDHIYATLLGSTAEHDGYSADSFGSPSVEAQQALLEHSYQIADVELEDVSYIECHGTGTPVGDLVEVTAIANTFSKSRTSANPLLVGSVKSNIGHTDAASGIAGLIKSALSLFHGELPASLHCELPIDQLGDPKSRIALNQQHRKLSDRDGPNIFGVSSLGLCGSNVHVVLAENVYATQSQQKATPLPIWERQSYWFEPNSIIQEELVHANFSTANQFKDNLIWIRELVSKVAQTSPEELSTELPLLQLGVDSFLAIELQQEILSQQFPIEPNTDFLLDSSMQQIAQWITDKTSLISVVMPDQSALNTETTSVRRVFNEF